jgi:hypothetical protein
MRYWTVELISADKHQLHVRVNAKTQIEAEKEAKKRVKELGWQHYGYKILKVTQN